MTTLHCTRTSITDAELAAAASTIAAARDLWTARCNEYHEKNGDQGTCVLGAGIAVDYRAPRCRRSQQLIIIPAHSVTGAQGASVWEASVKEVLGFLKERGIDARYAAGNMD